MSTVWIESRTQRVITLTQVYNPQVTLDEIGKETNLSYVFPVLWLTLMSPSNSVFMHTSAFSCHPLFWSQTATIIFKISFSSLLPLFLKCMKWWKWKLLSRVWLFVTPWTIQSMEFSRPEYWSGQPFPSPGHLPNPGYHPSLLHCRWILYQLSQKECVWSGKFYGYFDKTSNWWTGAKVSLQSKTSYSQFPMKSDFLTIFCHINHIVEKDM